METLLVAVRTIDRALLELREDLTRVNYLIRLLDSMARGSNRRGRPPAFLSGHAGKNGSRPGNRHRKRR